MSFGVKFIEGVDIYLQATRAVKYGILFISLSFVTFFIYETLKKMRIHPVQYTLVGLAIAVFYLLLVSLSEHIAFGPAYGISTCACISLLTYYIRHVLGTWKDAIYFTLLYGFLYGILYVIIQSEDAALLMGSLLIFSVLACIMVTTRKINWYEFNPGVDAKQLGKMLRRTDRTTASNNQP
jgi:inner membrane protein